MLTPFLPPFASSTAYVLHLLPPLLPALPSSPPTHPHTACSSCGNPQGQVQDLHTFLSEHNVRFGMVWLDIEGPGLYWGHDLDANAQFIQDLISEARAVGFHLGMYTSLSQYPGIVGSGTFASDLPLWYADYDGVPSFDDFRPFNGWSHPAIKQFSDAGSKCGASYDINCKLPIFLPFPHGFFPCFPLTHSHVRRRGTATMANARLDQGTPPKTTPPPVGRWLYPWALPWHPMLASRKSIFPHRCSNNIITASAERAGERTRQDLSPAWP